MYLGSDQALGLTASAVRVPFSDGDSVDYDGDPRALAAEERLWRGPLLRAGQQQTSPTHVNGEDGAAPEAERLNRPPQHMDP